MSGNVEEETDDRVGKKCVFYSKEIVISGL
jgi:hypothetical protein